MTIMTDTIVVRAAGPGFTEITGRVAEWLEERKAAQGQLTLFIRHTSASLTIQENADPAVQADLADALARLAPEDHPYRHASEGPDDMPSHIKAMVTNVSLTVPVADGRMMLGTWQGVYLIEHRAQPREREIVLQLVT